MYGTDRRSVVTAVVAMLVGGGIGAVAAGVLRPAKVEVPIAWAAALGATLAILTLSLRSLTRTLDIPIPHRTPVQPIAQVADPLLTPWERRLGASSRDRRMYIAGLQPVLADLARERMRLHHALDLDLVLRDPIRARHILGDDLWFWLTTTDQDGPPPRPAELQALVTAVQAL